MDQIEREYGLINQTANNKAPHRGALLLDYCGCDLSSSPARLVWHLGAHALDVVVHLAQIGITHRLTFF